MSKILAIKGDEKRGNEVIALLEMMGGKNCYNLNGLFSENAYYFIGGPHNNEILGGEWMLGNENIYWFTLEEFLKKYPFKVGDKVVYEDDNDIVVISEIIWDDTVGDIFYNVKSIDEDDCFLCPPELLKPYKETNMNKKKKLAIKGHPTRGKEVIELLEMLGGRAMGALRGNTDWYTIDEDENNLIKIYGHNYIRSHEFVVLTLEEFWEKYPFKIGDKVVYTKFGDNCDDYPVVIEAMKWTGTTIEYTFDDCVTCLAKDLKMWNGEPDAVISGIYLNSCDYADEVELNLGDYDIEIRDGKTYAVKKKPVYPKTYEECCKALKISKRAQLSYTNPEVERGNTYLSNEKYLLDAFMKLRVCRNAYWKIAGEQMGLGKPWEPDWKDDIQLKYFIRTKKGEISLSNTIYYTGVLRISEYHNIILTFPTEEMRDTFYENFKELIEQCKELL